MKKKYFSYLMTSAMIVSMSLSMLPSFSPEISTVYAAEVFDIEEKEGTIQGNITYKLDSSGVLHIYNPNETTLPTTNDGLEEYLAAAQKETHISTSISTALTNDSIDVTKIKEIKFENNVVFDSMYQMFKDMESLTTINWDKMRPDSSWYGHYNTLSWVTRVTHYEQMFYNCKSIKEIDLSCLFGGDYLSREDVGKNCSSWQSNLEDAFCGCENLEKIIFGDTSIAHLVSICYRYNYQGLQYASGSYTKLNATKSICSFGKDDNRNYFYDWSAYFCEKESDSTSSTRIVNYITRSPITFKLIYYKKQYNAADGTIGSHQQILNFTAEDKSVNLPIDEEDSNYKIVAYKWAFDKYKYNDWNIPDSYREDEFTSFNPREFLSLFITPNSSSNNKGTSSLAASMEFGDISTTDVHFDGQTPTMEIRDMLVPVYAADKEIEYDINYRYLYNGEEIAVDNNEYCIPNEKNVDKMVGKTQRIYLPYLYNTAYDNGVRVERIEYAFDNGSTVVISDSGNSYLNIDNKYAQPNSKTVTVIYYLDTYTSDKIADIDKYIKQLTEKDMPGYVETPEEPKPEPCPHTNVVEEDDPDNPGVVLYRCTECKQIVSASDGVTTPDTPEVIIKDPTDDKGTTEPKTDVIETQTPTPTKTVTPSTTTTKPDVTTNETTEKKDETEEIKIGNISGLKAINKKGKKVIVGFKKANNAQFYQLQIATKKNMKKGLKNYIIPKTTHTLKKLKRGKTYYIRVRGLSDDYAGKWSKIVKVKIKK